jgi:hypothetical protein
MQNKINYTREELKNGKKIASTYDKAEIFL